MPPLFIATMFNCYFVVSTAFKIYHQKPHVPSTFADKLLQILVDFNILE